MVKRLFDIVASFAGLIFLAPILIPISLAIHLDSPGPGFYRATRVGRDGRLYKMYKFRTMVANAEQRGPPVTAGDDPRITHMGRFLRRTKLDELPTLWNVLIGDMSLVGPRPENPKSAALYTEEQRCIWIVRPGITSMATIKYRNEESLLAGVDGLEARYFEIMQDKLRLELEYVDNLSLLLDLDILLRTAFAIFSTEVPDA